MKKILTKGKNLLFNIFLILGGVWIIFALAFQMYGVFLIATNQDDEMARISNEITWKIDGRFKDDPKNIWYTK